MKYIVAILFFMSCAFADRSIIIAYDGTYLGQCNGAYGRDSISDPYSKYGDAYASHSIFNEYGRYGGQYSNYSPYNPYSVQAPYILKYSEDIYQAISAYDFSPTEYFLDKLHSLSTLRLSVNKALPNSIDPDAYKAYCRQQ